MDSDALLNRELSWLDFNARVLAEAGQPSVPLLERVKFIAICSSNLDEFFQVRVAALKNQLAAGISSPGPDGRTPEFLFTDNETNTQLLYGCPCPHPFTKDAFHEAVVHGDRHIPVDAHAVAHFGFEIHELSPCVVFIRV
jgi:hypothetical protein